MNLAERKTCLNLLIDLKEMRATWLNALKWLEFPKKGFVIRQSVEAWDLTH